MACWFKVLTMLDSRPRRYILHKYVVASMNLVPLRQNRIIGNVHKEFDEVWKCGSCVDRHTDRQTHTLNTILHSL